MKNDLWHSLKTHKKPIYIYGMGNGADLILDKLASVGVNVQGIFASENFVRGQSFRGFKVEKYSDVIQKQKNIIVLTAFGSQLNDVIDNVKNIANEQELYVPDAPVYGSTFFDSDFFNRHKKELSAIKNSLADERSKNVFENIIRFKLSGDINLLFSIEDNENKELENILKLEPNSRIYDLGAFIGDTAEKFANLCPKYGEIIAVEPDEKNFSKLLTNTVNMRNFYCVNSAIGYLNGRVFFGGEGGRNQTVHVGKKNVSAITVDALCQKYGKPDFIKYDIEGEELNGIIGAENTIKKFKPKLMISAYHRSEDIISIPQKVLSLRNDYKVYIRHFPYIPCWDTYYFFV